MPANEIAIRLTDVSYTYPEEDFPVFLSLSLDLPRGIVSFLGQNGTGKSTTLLLAGGRLLPENGSVSVMGKDTREFADENEKNRYVSFIYQNMEFETDEKIGDLLGFVYENGFHTRKDGALIETLVKELELGESLSKSTGSVSKGELQRAIIAFSLLYGSKIVMMDEPIFALEFEQKERAMGFIRDYARDADLSVYFSIHEFEISRRYSDHVVLFYKDRTVRVGTPDEILTRETIEDAYEIPYGMLYHQERLHRRHLNALGKITGN
jgi:iron complex transport system ATP-binding protein